MQMRLDFVELTEKVDQEVNLPTKASIVFVGNRDERNAALWYMHPLADPQKEGVDPKPPEMRKRKLKVIGERRQFESFAKAALLGNFTMFGVTKYFVFEVTEDSKATQPTA